MIELANKNLLKSFHDKLKAQGSVSKVPLEVGDLVLLRVPHLSGKSQKVIYKFFHLYEGPYKISKIKGGNAFYLTEIDSEKEKGTYNRLSLKKFHVSDFYHHT